jgi:alkyl hydroperoxide reductase subunit AhpF
MLIPSRMKSLHGLFIILSLVPLKRWLEETWYVNQSMRGSDQIIC